MECSSEYVQNLLCLIYYYHFVQLYTFLLYECPGLYVTTFCYWNISLRANLFFLKIDIPTPTHSSRIKGHSQTRYRYLFTWLPQYTMEYG